MSTETATITGIKRDIVAKTGEDFIDVEVTFTDEENNTEVRKYGYPIETTQAQIKADIKQQLKARKRDREDAERAATQEAEEAPKRDARTKADKTVKALEGVTVK